MQRLANTPAQLVLVQEHHMRRERLEKEHEQLKKDGWLSWFAPAVDTGKGGTSGGVGFAWRPSVDICREPEELVPGRLVVTAMRTKLMGITFVYSIYGVVGDQLRTEAIWEAAYRHSQEHGMPFLIGGDHNFPPEVMAERWPGPLVMVCAK